MLMRTNKSRKTFAWITLVSSLALAGFSGCERKERVIDVKTPGVDVKVDRNVDTGRVDVNANHK